MKNEDTVFDQEATGYHKKNDEATLFDTTGSKVKNDDKKAAGSLKWRSAAVGAGAGVLMGAGATILTSATTVDPDSPAKPGHDGTESPENPVWVDDQIPVATTVTDEMSFADAFETARTEVGAGGVFEWRGNIYNTYTADEWNAMSDEERAEFGSHFDWPETPAATVVEEPVVVQTGSHTAQGSVVPTQGDDIEVVSVDHPTVTPANNQMDNGDLAEDEPEVQVLGVVQDESGAYVGGMVVDGQEALLVDVDGDMTFDAMAVDVNGDGQISDNEIVDISDQQIAVNDFANMAEANGNLYASDDSEPDYLNDAPVYES